MEQSQQRKGESNCSPATADQENTEGVRLTAGDFNQLGKLINVEHYSGNSKQRRKQRRKHECKGQDFKSHS